ncbi:MAG: polyhydroxybutyrate depolymerase [Paracoccaceae bacterium]
MPVASALGAGLAAALLALAGAAPARACEAPETPCAAPGGVYHLATPEGEGPHPAVMFLHGWGGRAAGVIATEAVVAPLLAAGWAVVAPQGEPRRPGEAGGPWNSRNDPEARDDVAFLASVAGHAAETAGLARGRMLLAGFSGGGMMAWRQACDAPESFRAYLPIAGLLWRPLPEACAGPVRLLHVHGWSDPVVPMEGRSVAGGRLTQGDLFAGLDLLRRANGCARDDPDAYGAEGAFLLRRWTDCAPGSALGFALFDGGHRIPEGWAALALGWEPTLDAD